MIKIEVGKVYHQRGKRGVCKFYTCREVLEISDKLKAEWRSMNPVPKDKRVVMFRQWRLYRNGTHSEESIDTLYMQSFQAWVGGIFDEKEIVNDKD